MGSPRWLREERMKSESSTAFKVLESVVVRVIESVRANGYGEDVCMQLRDHCSRLPARYTLNIDADRYEDVLLHMNLLQEAREAEEGSIGSSTSHEPVVPQFNVRKVQLSLGSHSEDDFSSSTCPQNDLRSSCCGIKIPKPAFGSSTNLAGLGSPKVHPLRGSFSRPRSGPPRGTPSRMTPPGSQACSIPRPAFGNFTNPLHMDDESIGCNSDHEGAGPAYGYEITLATADRHGLLKYFTRAISSISCELNIKEAHVFSTTDRMALEVFVVEGWGGDEPEELARELLLALNDKLGERSPECRAAELQAAAEAIQYEDWAVDHSQLVIGEKIGNGSSGQMYRGKYLSQDVAIKIFSLDGNNINLDSDSLSSFPAKECFQTFKQEVSIMRLVRHKNLVQFIGACSWWPKVYIVTELMAGGSVRDLLESRRSGLDVPSAVKVLRDAARGMDFLHKRGIVHRDLKAANLLIDEHDVVKICDFGIARLEPPTVSSSREMTAETGTYRWMAPEVLEHKPYDHKADVYSFGITLWEVLTGEVPYWGLTPLQAAIGVVQRGLRPVIPSSVPEKLATLAQYCWQQEPRQRPEFSEVLTVLEEMVTPPTLFRRGLFGKKLLSHHNL